MSVLFKSSQRHWLQVIVSKETSAKVYATIIEKLGLWKQWTLALPIPSACGAQRRPNNLHSD
ncbi:hypothetical protein PAAG_08615 [Paracoccidioides lutzii Pb01]|uniref:Uncharacterized protein n=1 Tax=Paracoccidioides lutzii (strain ATCC MYA-826 / Pb01) TaxID=502779 RepID=C1HCX4_PARBA|nr:hypothetical protein PAAG_08615 [Paracoccidioides lutzii Pb01]EEH39346.2 hypothetical protein PAAG_08615 [Paracoccidioides lutzii Pb01]